MLSVKCLKKIVLFIYSGECISGALWWRDLVKLVKDLGFGMPRLVSTSIFEVGNKELEDLLGMQLLPLYLTNFLQNSIKKTHICS